MKTNKKGLDWDIKVRARPTARQISQLALSRGWSAADEPWGWLDHTLTNILKDADMDSDECPRDLELEDLEP